MTYDLVRTIDAATEPVTIDQVQAQCRIDNDDDNAYLSTLITAARQYCEKVTGRAFLSQTWRLSLEGFPCWRQLLHCVGETQGYSDWRPCGLRAPEILLPRPYLLEVVSITYLDLTGTRQTLDPSQYTVVADAEPARVLPALGCVWPYALWQRGSVQITYAAGYLTGVPGTIQLAILMLVAHWYENREATVLPVSGTGVVSVPLGVAELLDAETFTAFTLES
jgi:uncharacterized phiE125 gp8 family phage protein